MIAQELVSGGEPYLQHLVDVGAQEGLSIEFKGGKILRDGSPDQAGKETLASTLSSMANSAGGVLVIGIDCRRHEGVDCARSLEPVNNLAKALTSMTDFVAEAIHPRHNGITVQAIPTQTTPGAGYLVVDVPKSERRPHMNQIAKTYWKRSGASKFRMEHYDVEDAFRRRTSPDLTVAYELTGRIWPVTQNVDEFRYDLRVAAKNEGSGSARHLCLQYLPARTPHIGNRSNYVHSVPYEESDFDGVRTLAFPQEFVVHPGTTMHLASFYFTLRSRAGHGEGPVLTDRGSVRLELRLTAEGMLPATTVIELSKETLRSVSSLIL